MTMAPPTSGPAPAAVSSAAGPRPLEGDSSTDPAGWRRPPPTVAQQRSDVLAALGVFAGALLSMALWRITGLWPDPASPVVSVTLLALITLPLAVRRRWPSAVAVVVSAFFVVAGELVIAEDFMMSIALFVALYTVGAWEQNRRRATVVRAAVVSAMFLWLLISFFRVAMDPPEGDTVEIGPGTLSPLAAYMLIQFFVNVLYFAGAVWFGSHAWSSARNRTLVEQRAQELQAERALVEAQAVTIERMRLARELHDAVAHHVSLMGVQAAAARTLVGQASPATTEALERVEDSAREAITELHGLLSTLREDGEGRDEPVGSLGVQRLPDLVADSQAAGMQVDLQVIGEPVPLRPLASLNLYRIAQEALTNVRKHAGDHARADVRLRYLDDAIELEITDDGAGRRRRGSRADVGGLGLVGMRERVATDGGTLEARPLREGGFLVRAQIPHVPAGATSILARPSEASALEGTR